MAVKYAKIDRVGSFQQILLHNMFLKFSQYGYGESLIQYQWRKAKLFDPGHDNAYNKYNILCCGSYDIILTRINSTILWILVRLHKGRALDKRE